MNRKLAAGLSAGFTAALFAGWFAIHRNVERLDAALGRQVERVDKLDSLVDDADARIDEGYRRTDEARIRRESALRQIAEAESIVSAAAEERSQAESLTQEAQAREQEALAQAEEARRRESAERRRREEEWSRLGRALGTIGATRRDDWDLKTNLPAGLPNDKEKISRLAGILLAHHGYRVTVEGESAQAVASYLEQAGIPDDVLSRGETTGPLRLTLHDQILGR